MPLKGAGAPTTADRVRALASPDIYPHIVEEVEIRETHMSWVFLAGTHVYKLKKPVKSDVLDFSTPDARKINAEAEVRLNRRLAPDVYHGIVPLTEENRGKLALGRPGHVIDWLVHMRRLPADAMLDVLIAKKAVSRERIDALGDRLAVFYKNAQPADMTPAAYADRFAREQAENRSVLLDSGVALRDGETRRICDRVDAALRFARPLLEARLRDGHVVDGHGDLRPEHVCLEDPPLVIDCLEFNQELRLVDPFDELAFLGFECARLGAPWIRNHLIRHCAERLGEPPPRRMIAFYTAFRALVRARLALAHLFEPDPATPGKWRPQARQYVKVAAKTNLAPLLQGG